MPIDAEPAAPAQKTILFVGHDAYRAGAQVALLHLVKWMCSHNELRIVLLLKHGGELLADYQALVPTYVLSDESSVAGARSRFKAAFRHGLLRSQSHPPGLDALSKLRVDVLYVNSVASLDILPDLVARWHCPVVCHVHELEFGIQRVLQPGVLAAAQRHIDAFVAVSDAVKDNLCTNHHVETSRVYRIYEAIGTAWYPSPQDKEESTRVRCDLGLPPDAFVVGGCGTTDWRKAPDIYIQVARLLARTRPDLIAHFVWVGGQTSGAEAAALRYDLERLNLRSRVHFVGAQANPKPYFLLFDVFLLTSREDPFPLVCLEAAALGIPIVCFQGAGGIPEFVSGDAGVVVPYLDVEAAATSIARLVDRPELRTHLGRRGAEKVKSSHEIEITGRKILTLIDRLMQRVGERSS